MINHSQVIFVTGVLVRVMPIPTSHMKERLSVAYIHAVAAKAGVKVLGLDIHEYGIDGYFQRIREWRQGQFKETGPQIQFQVKASWAWGFQNDVVFYDMNTEAYDKLVDVTEDDSPTLLFLFCMPGEDLIDTWLSVSEEELILKHCCYWDSIAGEVTGIPNSTKRIKIPRNQILTPDAIESFFDMWHKGELK